MRSITVPMLVMCLERVLRAERMPVRHGCRAGRTAGALAGALAGDLAGDLVHRDLSVSSGCKQAL